jgi:hypothetical protein
MTLYLWKAHLQTFLSISITQKCQTLSCDTLVANERYALTVPYFGPALFLPVVESERFRNLKDSYVWFIRSLYYVLRTERFDSACKKISPCLRT